MGIGWGSELSLASLASDPTAKLFSRATPDMRPRLRPLSNISLIHADITPDDSYAPSNAHLTISLKIQPSLRESGSLQVEELFITRVKRGFTPGPSSESCNCRVVTTTNRLGRLVQPSSLTLHCPQLQFRLKCWQRLLGHPRLLRQ
jgi:hypothetical protein